MKLFIETFGCQMNEADSEEMAGHLNRYGLTAALKKEDADVLLLNTCTVRQHAEDKALSFIGRLKPWKKKDPRRVLIVAGCAAERLQKTLQRRFPHVDLVVGAKSIEKFPEIVGHFLKKKKLAASKPRDNGSADPVAAAHDAYNWFEESESTFEAKKSRSSGDPLVMGAEGRTAFVTIMRGCNYTCSYCVVPFVRGRERYRPFDDILEEVRAKVKAGAAEVMLLGQTVNSYWHKTGEAGKAGIKDFADLVRALDAVEGVTDIRFMSPHPHYMSDKLIRTLGECKKVSRFIHVPVQSGSDRMLKAMKRNYSREEFVAMSRKLRAARPDLALSTDFIVGFPGETEEDFEATLSLVDAVPLGLAYCFKYSPRQGTESSCFQDDVPRAVKEKRLARLLKKIEAGQRALRAPRPER